MKKEENEKKKEMKKTGIEERGKGTLGATLEPGARGKQRYLFFANSH